MILYDRYYLQNCKTITSEKLQIIQNMKDLMFQVIFIFSDWILIKQIIVSSIPFYSWGKQILEIMLPGGMSNFLLPWAWWQKLEDKFWVGRTTNENASNQCIFQECELHRFENFSRTWWNIKVWKKIQQAFWREIKP